MWRNEQNSTLACRSASFEACARTMRNDLSHLFTLFVSARSEAKPAGLIVKARPIFLDLLQDKCFKGASITASVLAACVRDLYARATYLYLFIFLFFQNKSVSTVYACIRCCRNTPTSVFFHLSVCSL